jgi:EAL domain-containing protein (putative c-di-GMP-specific phosphodiesterase class I)
MFALLDPTIPSAPSVATRFDITVDTRAEAAQRRRLRRDLGAAAAGDAFVLTYRPRLSLATGRHSAAEAEIAWPHRRRGVVSAKGLLRCAGEAGLLVEIGGWMLATACTEAANWPTIAVSVAVSPRQLTEGALARQAAAALEASGLAPDRLDLLLPEGALEDGDGDTLLALAAIRDLGVGVTVDEFGNGAASLTLLKRMPLTGVKLARTLVRDLPRDGDDAAIVRAVIDAAHALGLAVIADGIESDAQRAFLARSGCDEGQGPFFGQRLPANAVGALR